MRKTFREVAAVAIIPAIFAIAVVRAALVDPSPAPDTTPATMPTSRPTAAELRAIYQRPPETWPKALVDPGVKFVEIGKLPPPQFPADNPLTQEKESLGRQLFFDPRLSGSGQIACASCHDPDLAWADGRTVSFGHDRAKLRRNAPGILFSAYLDTQFWDGRSGSLEDQLRSPVVAHDEMNARPAEVESRLNDIPGYRKQFKEIFGVDQIKLADVAKAVATFQRALAINAGRSPFDKFMAGDEDKLTDSAVRGLHLFRADARCVNCHHGPAFTDNEFHDIGLSYYGRENEDLGRYNVTLKREDVGKFRTPSLRNVGRTRPYMHNGLFELEGILNMYSAGMPTLRRNETQHDDELFPTKDALLKPLKLNKQDREDLKAFLESLSEPPLRMRPPKLPRAEATTRETGTTRTSN